MHELFMLLINYFTAQCESSLRIYGGRDALRGEFPYVVRLEDHTIPMFNGKAHVWLRCTGAALTPSWILSAAHCVDEDEFTKKHEKLVARYNSHFPEHLGNIRTVLEAKMHPTYEKYNSGFDDMLNNDVCLFRSEGIELDSYGKLSPVDYRSLVGHEAYTLGFGRTNYSKYQKPLQVLKGMLYDCLTEDTSNIQMLCLAPQCGVPATICGGDSGGPVVHSSGIVGVNSRSIGNCNEYSKDLNVPRSTPVGEFATVSLHFDWLSNIILNISIN